MTTKPPRKGKPTPPAGTPPPSNRRIRNKPIARGKQPHRFVTRK